MPLGAVVRDSPNARDAIRIRAKNVTPEEEFRQNPRASTRCRRICCSSGQSVRHATNAAKRSSETLSVTSLGAGPPSRCHARRLRATTRRRVERARRGLPAATTGASARPEHDHAAEVRAVDLVGVAARPPDAGEGQPCPAAARRLRRLLTGLEQLQLVVRARGPRRSRRRLRAVESGARGSGSARW